MSPADATAGLARFELRRRLKLSEVTRLYLYIPLDLLRFSL